MTEDHFPSDGQTSFDPETRDPQETGGPGPDEAAADPAASAPGVAATEDSDVDAAVDDDTAAHADA